MGTWWFISCEDPKVEDTTPPSVAITSPQNNSVVNEIVQVMCISLDNDKVEKVELWLDGSFTGIYDISEPYSLEWNTTTYENRTFTITVRSFDVSGNAADSSPFSLTVDNSLSVPTAISIASISYGPGGFTITWDKSIDGDFESYSLDKSLFPDMNNHSQIFSSLDIDDTVYVDSDIDPLVFQYYRVTVTDSLNYFSLSTVDSSDLDPIPSPVDIESVSYDTTAMTITWEKSNETDFLHYELYQSSGDSNNYAIISTITDINISEYSLSEFDPLQINYFRVLVFDTLGQYAQGDYYSNSIDSPPNSVNVTSVTYTVDEMTVSWDQYVPNLYRLLLRSATEMENDFVSYDVLYSETANGDRELLNTYDQPSVTSHTLYDYDPTHENWFWIRVNDYWGQTSIGNGSTNTIEPLPESVDVLSVEYDLTQMSVTWEQFQDEDFYRYDIYYSLSEDEDKMLLSTYFDAESITHTLDEYNPAHENWFWVEVTDIWGQRIKGQGLSNTVDASPMPVNITDVTYSTESMVVWWDESQDYDFASYELYQSVNGNLAESILLTDNVSTITFTLVDFEPAVENLFHLKVTDYWGLVTSGASMANDIELPPSSVTVNPITYADGFLNISWSQNTEEDFHQYSLYESSTQDMLESEQIFTTNNQDETSHQRASELGGIHYYQIVVSDVFNLETYSNVERGGEYTLFNTAFGGSDDEVGYSVDKTSGGGYIMAGYTETYGNGLKDVWLVKTNSSGNEEWSQTFGSSSMDEAKCVQTTSDNGFIVAGSTVNGTSLQLYLIKTDELGVEQWSHAYSGGSGSISGESVKETNDGGYIITGDIVVPDTADGLQTDMLLLKVDVNGNEAWRNHYGGMHSDNGYSVIQTSDGGFIAAGYYSTFDTTNGNDSDWWLVKTNSSGVVEWNQTYGEEGFDYAYSVIETIEGGFTITGSFAVSGGIDLLNISESGDVLWNQAYFEGTGSHGNSVQQTYDGGYIVAGTRIGRDAILVKTNQVGEQEWAQEYGGSSPAWLNSVQQTNDGGYIASGSSRSFSFGERDAYLVKTDPEGNTVSIE